MTKSTETKALTPEQIKTRQKIVGQLYEHIIDATNNCLDNSELSDEDLSWEVLIALFSVSSQISADINISRQEYLNMAGEFFDMQKEHKAAKAAKKSKSKPTPKTKKSDLN